MILSSGISTGSKSLLLVASLVLGLAGLSGCSSSGPDLPSENTTSTIQDKNSLSDEGLTEAKRQLLAEFPDAIVPVVDRIRFVTLNDVSQVRADCLTELGFPTTVSADGGYGGIRSVDQKKPLAIAEYTCAAKYPVDPAFTQALSASQLESLYAYYTGDLTACLEKNGVSVPDAPSLQTFIDGYSGPNAWTPFLAFLNSDKDASQIEQVCPQVPANLFG